MFWPLEPQQLALLALHDLVCSKGGGRVAFDWGVIGKVAGGVAGGVSAVYGVFKGFMDGRAVIGDMFDRGKYHDGYRVKATVCKVVIRAERTEYMRLRTLRANRKVISLRIDHQPVIQKDNGAKRLAVLSNCYSMPGRLTLSPDDNMFHIELMDDEALRAHKDHPVVLGYIMEETEEELFTPPGVSIVPPVGSDYAVIEVRFPAGYLLSLDANGNPVTRFYSKHSKTKAETPIPSKHADVQFAKYDRNWIRARVEKPPQDSEVRLDWEWRKPTGVLRGSEA